ncbi:MAG: ATP-dependent DNA helicase RecQ [Deltaproteobacteria bacterium]|nr:ATP-dependent DNA helicase RecQ [Deltaproteobacteria bacterium]
MDLLDSALAQHFGFSGFRPGQRPVVEAILASRPVVAVMPTGAGKSLCYQLPALCLDGVTLVVSPLISLMKDQVDGLRRLGVPAAFVNSTQDPGEQRQVLEDAASGALKLLYVAPERFRYDGAMAVLRRLPIALFVVDEAHCISSWGHDFRPDYLGLGRAVGELGAQRVAAFTATATERVRADIVSQLGLHEPLVTITGFLRPNLHLSVVPIRRMTEKTEHLRRLLAGIEGSVVIYCATRRHCEDVALTLSRLGISAGVYHGGLDDEARRDVQDAFQGNTIRVIVATNAFGMGIDKPDVRAVVHYDIPGSLEAYYQEAGRAGRDGAPARCVLLFTYADTRIHEFFIDKGGEELPVEQRTAFAEVERQKLKQIVRYAYEEGCRHSAILRYFGERRTIGDEGCGACDHCTGDSGVPGLKPKKARDEGGATTKDRALALPTRPLSEDEEIVVQKALSAVARASGRVARTELARVLRGDPRPEVASSPLAETKSFGILSDHTHTRLMALLSALDDAGCTTGRRPTLTPLGHDVMWRRRSVELALAPERPSRRGTASSPPVVHSAEERDLLDALKEARLQAAREAGLPAYCIATNRVLEALVAAPPEPTLSAWLAVRGVGEKNVDVMRAAFEPVLASAGDAATSGLPDGHGVD